MAIRRIRSLLLSSDDDSNSRNSNMSSSSMKGTLFAPQVFGQLIAVCNTLTTSSASQGEQQLIVTFVESKIIQAARAFIVSVCPDVIDHNSVLCDNDSEKQHERNYEDGLFAALLLSWRKYSQFIKYMSSLFHHMDVTSKQKNHTIMYVNLLAGSSN